MNNFGADKYLQENICLLALH